MWIEKRVTGNETGPISDVVIELRMTCCSPYISIDHHLVTVDDRDDLIGNSLRVSG